MVKSYVSIVTQQAQANNWSLDKTASATHIARQLDHSRAVASGSRASGAAKEDARREIDRLIVQISALDRWGGGDY
jgi:hypothetical protein